MSPFKGNSGNNQLQGTSKADTLDGFDGNDTLKGGSGNDVLAAYSHDGRDEYGDLSTDAFGRLMPHFGDYQDKDFLFGEDGDDMLIGNRGEDSIEGGNGNDTLSGDYGDDFLSGGSGDDVIYSIPLGYDFYLNQGKVKIDESTFSRDNLYDNNDTLYGGDGNDVFYISSQQSYSYGEKGNDTFYLGDVTYSTIYGGDGNDKIEQKNYRAGEISIDGGNGNDSLILPVQGYLGSILIGGNGDDTLQGGTYMEGGDGNDKFYVVDDQLVTAVIDGGAGGNTLFASAFNNKNLDLPDFELLEISKFAKSEAFLKDGVTIQIELAEKMVNMNKINDSAAITYLLQNGFTHFIKLRNDHDDENIVFSAFLKNIQSIEFADKNLNLNGMIAPITDLSTPVAGKEISGTDGNDTLIGTKGDDTIEGESGNDLISGGAGADSIEGSYGNDTIRGEAGNDIIKGEYGADSIEGGDGDDILDGGGWDAWQNSKNLIYGNGGNDTIYTGGEFDIADGGDGNDTINISDYDKDSLSYGYGAAGNDYLTCQNGSTWLDGGNGNDTIVGGNLNDYGSAILIGGDGDDLFQLQENHYSQNWLEGGKGNDIFEIMPAADKISVNIVVDGGAGQNLITLPLSKWNYTIKKISELTNASITTNLSDVNITTNVLSDISEKNEPIQLTGQNAVDFLSTNGFNYFIYDNKPLSFWSSAEYIFFKDIQNFKFNGETASFNSLLYPSNNSSNQASNGDDLLLGTNKADTISGLDGNDIVIGGLGADKLTGGKGADVFRFSSSKDSGITKTTRDTITDFKHSENDKIDLASIDADERTPGSHQQFIFIGEKSFNSVDATGRLRFDSKTSILYGSTDKDSAAEFSIQLSGVKSLVADDFIL